MVSDHIYTSEDGTGQVYDTSVRSLVVGAVEGVDGTAFAYGGESTSFCFFSRALGRLRGFGCVATGSGKTHTLVSSFIFVRDLEKSENGC